AIGDGISDTSMGLSSIPRGCQGMMIKILRVRYVNGSSEVTDENGTIIGTEMTYALMFGDKYHHNSSGRNVKGLWFF
ncbi:hypothetical protein Tco_0225927, partial [Tanacetum coccineum]